MEMVCQILYLLIMMETTTPSAPPGLTEDLDDDNDGSTDLNESTDGTDSLNPDTDGDGFCDGINAVPGVCFAGPDPFPLDPTLPVDTDGDGYQATIQTGQDPICRRRR